MKSLYKKGFSGLPVLVILGLLAVSGAVYLFMSEDKMPTSSVEPSSAAQSASTMTVSGSYSVGVDIMPGKMFFYVDEKDAVKLLGPDGSPQRWVRFSNDDFARQSLKGERGIATIVVTNFKPGKPNSDALGSVELVQVVQ